MKSEQAALLAEGREEYLRLLDDAKELLRKLDTGGPETLAAVLQRRQGSLELLQNLDRRLAELGGVPAEFRAFREETTRRILEVDGLVIALAGQRQDSLKRRLSELARAKSASRAYEGSFPAGQRPWVNNKV